MNHFLPTEQVRQFVYTPTMFDDDRNFKCYVYCLYNTIGAIQPNGKIDPTPFLKSMEGLPAEQQIILLNMGKLCFKEKDKDTCERLYKSVKCMKTTDMKHFFIQ